MGISLGKDIVLATILSNLLALVLPVVILQIYDRIIPNAAYETLSALAIGLFVAFVFDIVLKVARNHLLARAGARFERELTARMVNRLLTGDLALVEQDQPGDHLERLKSIERLKDFKSSDNATAWLEIPFAIVFLAIIAFISPLLAGLVLAIGTLSIYTSRGYVDQMHVATQARLDIDNRRHSFLIEVLKAIEATKSLGVERLLERRYERLMGSSATAGARAAFLSQAYSGFNGSLMQLSTSLVAIAGAILVINQQISAGALAASMLLAGRALQPLMRYETMVGRKRELDIWETKLGEFLHGEDDHRGSTVPGSIEKIEFENVTYSPAGGDPILLGINLKVARGETIVISGANGSGKSTLMWVATGRLFATEGRVRVNNVDLRECAPQSISDRIAYLPQRHALLEGTVLENITRFDPQANLSDALLLVEQIGLGPFFRRHPQGFSMKVQSGAAGGLPPAIVNMISIVRSLVGNPDVVLFDEANLSLDRDIDERLLELLRQLKPNISLVLVTQRPSYAQLGDRHYRLEGRRLIEAEAPTRRHEAPQASPEQSASARVAESC